LYFILKLDNYSLSYQIDYERSIRDIVIICFFLGFEECRVTNEILFTDSNV